MNSPLFEELKSTQGFFLIAGPCLAESEQLVMKTADFLTNLAESRKINLIFKSSYKKANRTSIHSPVGPGLELGLKYLEKVKTTFALPILTDVHETSEIAAVSQLVDVIQIPAFLCRQTDLIVKAGKTNRIVNLKKGQFMAPEDMVMAAEKVTETGNKKVLLTERGTCFGYHDLVVDFRSFAIMAKSGFPVVFDVTHSQQRPSLSNVSKGTTDYAVMLTRAALATKQIKGLFLETHPEPEKALSDATTQIRLDNLPALLDELNK